MKLQNLLNYKTYFLCIYIILLSITNITSGIIEPDDNLPLEITPSYDKFPGISGTKFVFRFFIPNYADKDSMPTMRGYGATNGQYIGIKFTQKVTDVIFTSGIKHKCEIIQIENNLNIPLTALDGENNVIYCKIDSYSNENLLLPGYNYKLTITLLDDFKGKFNNLISITIFTSTQPNSNENEIIDIGTFNHINIIHLHNPSDQYNSIASLTAVNGNINIEVESNINFDIKITFNGWFSWDDYIVCINIPKNQINADNPVMEIDKPAGSNIEIPLGDINNINLESNEARKYIGFFLDNSGKDYSAGDNLLLKFSGLKAKDAGLIKEENSNNGYIGIELRYRNSYVICSSVKMDLIISLRNVQFTVKHPETSDDGNYIFDVFKSGAFQIEFNINLEKNVYNKYIVIKQKESTQNQRVTFIAPSCDFSDFNITSNNFNEIPKCNPIKHKNNLVDGSIDNNNGIFFYYPYVMKANVNYKIRVWIFFDECGPEEEGSTYSGDKLKTEIKFSLEMYNNLYKNKIAEERFDSNFIFLKEIVTEKGIICYNTYMGDKTYNSGYLFNMGDYSSDTKLLYREYFHWNIYDFNGQTDENSVGNEILNSLFSSDEKTPRFIYSKKDGNKLSEGSNLLLVSKITLDSGNNEKLGQFFPIGLRRNSDGSKNPVNGKFFIKLSKNFFAKADTSKCYVSWAFGSPSIGPKEKSWGPKFKSYPKQKYNFIVSTDDFFEDSTALYEPLIEKIEDNYLESKVNEGWDLNNALWSFGDDDDLEDQISDDAPVDIYFALADTCHKWKNLDQEIKSLYTPIEIIIGVKDETYGYARVMRFIKLYPETGVWHDNTIDEGSDMFIRSSNFIIKNHFAFNEKGETDDELNEKGVCLLEIAPGILDSKKGLINTFFLWIFMGSLLESEYDQAIAPYPVGNIPDNVVAYGYSSQQSLNSNNFYIKPSKDIKSDITSPIYHIANSMSSLYQSATSGYLFYLGSLVVLYNKVKRNSMYDLANQPILIPYYCPYYNSKGEKKPYSLGIFPSFMAGFGRFESMTNLGNSGFYNLIGKKINSKQLNLLMLSDIKIYRRDIIHFYNTVKFINDYNNNIMTLNVWNSDKEKPADNSYDSIDSFIFFFNEKITGLNNVYPRSNIPERLKSISKSKKGDYCFYVYGKKFCSGIYGVTNTDLELTKNVPTTGNINPYLSINLNFEISSDLFLCKSNPDKFCPTDVVSYWGISANHDMLSYVTNYLLDSYLLDYHIYTNYINNKIPIIEPGQAMAFIKDPAIYVKIIFKSPFKTPILANTKLSFTIKDKKDAYCSVQSSDVDLPSANCDTDTNTGEITCRLVFSSLVYNIFCYGLDFGENGRFYFNNFKLNLPNDESYEGLGSLIFHDTKEYVFNFIPNTENEPLDPVIQGNYITTPFNSDSYSKLELTIDIKRPAHPGMKIEIIFDKQSYFDTSSECKFSLQKIYTYSMYNIDMDDYWKKGNANIYNCIIEDYSDAETANVHKVIATLDHTLYKAENVLSNIVYIYIWPFKAVNLVDYIFLSVTINNRNILSNSNTGPIKVLFSSINQFISTSQSVQKEGLVESIIPSSNILGDISDYQFTLKQDGINLNSISLIQLFFPSIINFECEECVKCYQNDANGKSSLITCNFADYNILNVFVSRKTSFVVTGIINPKKTIDNGAKIFVNFVYIESNGNRLSSYSTIYNLETIKYTDSPTIHPLRFFYNDKVVSDNNPRNEATYTFRISFDNANRNIDATNHPVLSRNSLMYIYFPRDYHLYINNNPTNTIVRYYYNDATSESFTFDAMIRARKILIKINQETKSEPPLKYIEIVINNIKNPNRIKNDNKYTGYFKIVCLNSPEAVQLNTATPYYYTTGINSNTFRSNLITNEGERSEEYNWYRGLLIKTNYTYIDKLIVDVLYDNKIYDFIFLQPGRYTKVHLVTSSDNEKISNFYLKPSYTKISFQNQNIKTLEDEYIIPSLNGDPLEFYIGVPCTINDGIYIVIPNIKDNKDDYLSPPAVIINVRQIETAKIEFIQEDIGTSPLNGKSRIYYYLTDINVEQLSIYWVGNFISTYKDVNIDSITIPEKTITNKTKKYSNVFSTASIKLKDQNNIPTSQEFSYIFVGPDNINRCFELSPRDLTIRESGTISFATFDLSPPYKLSDDLIIKTSENDDTILSNEIKLFFNPPTLEPTFILCELYCPYLTPDDKENLQFINYDSMNNYLREINQNHFKKYATNYFAAAQSSASLIFSNVIKGYNYNVQCTYQSTETNIEEIKSEAYIYNLENLQSAFPAKTHCNTFYFTNALSKNNQQNLVYYCQYFLGKILGNQGCIICSDCSGKIISPGYSLYFPFNCQKEQCYDYSNNSLINDMYDLAEEFNTKSETTKYEFTICVTSNRICSSQITNDNLNTAFNQFISEVADNQKVNELFEINYEDENYIVYSSFYQNKIFKEDKINIDNIDIEFIKELSYDGNAVIKASYKSEVNYNILCFWKIKLYEESTPNLEEMTNCKSDDYFCGVFVANYGGHQYKIPDNRRKNLATGVYSMYATCSNFVPSPVYFSEIKSFMTQEITGVSFSGNFLYINYIYLFILISLLL